MELIRINDDHYIIVDGISKEIGEYVFDDDYDKPLIYKTDKEFFDKGKEAFVITHSTEPLEKIGTIFNSPSDGDVEDWLSFDKIQPISIQEVMNAFFSQIVDKVVYELYTGVTKEYPFDKKGRSKCEFENGELKLIL